jgi:fatty-acyl-CoA synthase
LNTAPVLNTPAQPTPTVHSLPLRHGGFATLTAALDYAAQGETGCNFYTARGELACALPYRDLRARARAHARRLHALGLPRGARVALVAETDPEFVTLLLGCQYAGLTPVPLPASVHLGGHVAYVRQLRALLEGCQASVALAPAAFDLLLEEAAQGLGLLLCESFAAFAARAQSASRPVPAGPDELAYLQYTSGSTRFPRGVMITHRQVMANLSGITARGLDLNAQDRFFSWLPFYHDMGLIGLVFSPIAGQRSVDYLGTRDFAMRPRKWLDIMTANRNTIAFSPPFGYELVARRVRPSDLAHYELSAWRIAGVGAETIPPRLLEHFARALEPAGFSARAFVPCYGMAEAALAVTFAPLGGGYTVDAVDAEALAFDAVARPATPGRRSVPFTDCGRVLPDHALQIRDAQGRVLPARGVGTIHVRGPSVMHGYFGAPAATAAALDDHGWLDTGDVGYLTESGTLVVTGRSKDLLVINGRNIWPQDLEAIAESQPELRPEDSSAFAVPGADGRDLAVLVVQCREPDPLRRRALVERIEAQVQAELGVRVFVELVPPHTLPRTSSGKLSRSGARREFLERNAVHGGFVPHRESVAPVPS